MGYHAKLSPSSASRWTECTASINAQEGIPNENSEASMQGTCCHQLSAEVLQDGRDPQSYLGRKMLFWTHPESDSNGEDWESAFEGAIDEGRCFVAEVIVTQEMIDACTSATNYVQQLVETTGGELEVEQRVPVGHFTGEEGAGGTSDVCILTNDTIFVCDFKFGRHKVLAYDILVPAHTDVITGEPVPEKVRANLQMACYALGSIEKFGLLYDFKKVTMTIVQPFLNHVSEYSCTVEELMAVQEFLRVKAEETRTNPVFKPAPDSCHFCRASGNCEAQTQAVITTVLDGFEDVDTATPKPVTVNRLGSLYAAIPMITDWVKAVGERVYQELMQGHTVVRNDGVAYKLVVGKKGNREWRDAAEAEAVLKKMRLKHEQMYVSTLVGPATVEQLAKVKKAKKGETPTPPVLGATQWNRVQTLITQRDGSPSIALETDPRPAIAAATEGFDDVTHEVPQSCEDLF